MSQPVVSGKSRRTFALCVLLCAVLVPLVQVGLRDVSGRASSPWFWLVGTPVGYLLIGGLGGFCVSGGLSTALARKRGRLLGAIGGSVGAVVAALIATTVILLALYAPAPTPAQTSHVGPDGPSVVLLLLVIPVLVPLFLGVSLLGIALATLGGLVGGTLRANGWRGDGPTETSLVGGRGPRAWVVAGVIAMTLALLAIAAAVVLSTGAFAAIR